MRHLLDRIDIALSHKGATRRHLVDGVGLSAQSLSNLRRSPGSSLKPETIAACARWLGCDFYWLVTGQGGDYVPADTSHSPLALRVLRWIDEMPEADRARAVGYVAGMREGVWPTGTASTPDTDARSVGIMK